MNDSTNPMWPAAAAPATTRNSLSLKLDIISGELDDLVRFLGADIANARLFAAAILTEFQAVAFAGLVAEAGGQ